VSIATDSILPRPAFSPLVSPFETYHQVFWDVMDEPDFGITGRTRMLRLLGVSLATLHWRSAPAKAMIPETRGLVTDASMRLAVWKDRGLKVSAWNVALEFQDLFFGGLVSGQRVPLRGLDLIRATDELACCDLNWFCDVPTRDDPYTFETVRLKEALARTE
jgi:hypothetical protein